MRTSRFLAIILALLTFSNSKLFSQISGGYFAPVYSQDSLKGFDMNQAKINALGEGFYGQAFANAIQIYQRQYVINKYDLNGGWVNPISVPGGKYSPATTANAPCVNEGFETSTLAGWTASIGPNVNSQAYPTMTAAIVAGSQASVMTTSINDPYVGLIPNSPLGGTQVVRINDNVVNDYSVIKLSQTFNVTSTNYLFDFAYWAVLQDAPAHTCTQTPFMLVKIRDNSNILQTCPTFSIVAPATGGCAGIGPLSWVLVGTGANAVRTSVGWQKFSIDLTPYLFSTPGNITVEVFVGDCNQGGHFGYAYFDSRCNTMDLTVNSQTLSMPNPTVYPQVLCGTTATMTAPSGLGGYNWNGPVASGVSSNTNQTIVTSVPGNYSLTMTPAGICNPISKIINLQFVPPTTVTASPANLCATGTNTSSTLTASGASQYTWAPGGSTLSSIVVTPTVTTIYTLTAKTGTCLGTFTVQVTVNPDPVISVFSSNSSLCPGQTATLTAFNANSYVWNPGALTGSQVVVSQTATTTYTTIGTSTAGCTGSFTTTITSTTITPGLIFAIPALTGSICAGTPVTLAYLGASTVTWQPGGSSANPGTFTPTITTTYVGVGSVGACTNSAAFTVSVDTGPSMTLTTNPALTCPGNTTTLSVVSPGAVGAFTWNPGATNASSIIVTPTISGGYSVSAVDAFGCKNTQTINPTISPVPNINITPSTASVCAGSSATLTASGAVNYTWLPVGGNAATAVLTPTSTTTYTVIGANGAGCVNTQTVTITVVPVPTVNASVSPAAVCAGSCATITPGGASSYTIQGGSFIVCPLVNSTYTLIGSNAAGCVSSPTLVTVNVNPSPNVNVSANPATICAGSSSTLSALGAVNYTWSTGVFTSSIVVSPLSTQSYTVTGANAFGCTSTTVVTVNVNPIPNLSLTPSSASICPGSSVFPVATGATSYTWFPGPLAGGSVTLSPATSTTYTIVGSIGTCTSQTTLPVTVLPSPVITANYSPGTICAGSCATLTATGAVTNYIVTGLTNPVACPTITTNYTVVGVDANGCKSNTVTGTLFVTSGPPLIASANPATVCAGSSSTLSASGALNYTWSTGANSSSIVVTPLSNQTYTLIASNAAGCTSTALVNVNVTPFPSIIISPSSATICPGGAVTATAGGATSYTWSPGPILTANVTLSPLVSTTYTVVGAVGSCTGQSTMLVAVNTAPNISASFSPAPICAGSCATLSASGAVSYTVLGGLSAIACPTITTTYSVVGSDINGCTSNTVAGTLVVNNGPALIVSANPATICAGSSSTLIATGAFNYTWSTGPNTSSIIVTPLSNQTYTVTGSTAAGCTSSATVAVNVISAPTISISPTSTTLCKGNSITLTAGGASTYTWQPVNLNGSSIVVSPTITTTYTAFGSNGVCTGQNTVVITVVPVPTISAVYSPTAICAGSCATLNPIGASSYTILGLSAVACPTLTSSYTVTGSNAFGCISAPIVGSLPVFALPNIVASASPSNICPGDSSFVSATGGVSYTWQPGNTFATSFWAKPAVSTIYTVTGVNASGCTKSTTVSVNVSAPPTVFAIATPTAICPGGNSTLSGGGLTTYNWSPGALTGANVFVAPLVTTTYTLSGNAGACNGSTTVMVVVNPAPSVTITPSSSTICAGGSVVISLSGASTYTWSDGPNSVSRTLSPLVTTVYSVIGAGPTGCLSSPVSTTITVVTPPNLTASANPANICAGSASTLNATGALSYTWTPGPLFGPIQIVTPLSTTTYTVRGTGPGGCIGINTVVVNVTPAINLTALANPPIICVGTVVNLTAGGATNYTWLPAPLPAVASITVSPSISTTYTLIGNTGACSTQTTVFVTVGTNPILGISATSTSLCSGNCTTLTATGAINYTWSTGGTGTSVVVCPSSTQTYSVLGSVGICTGTAVKTIFVNTAPIVNISSSAGTICAGSSAVLTAGGATNYTWSTGSQLQSITVSPPSSTLYTVIGANGTCTSSANFALTVIPSTALNIIATSPSICAGYSVGLLATGAPSFTWLPLGTSVNPLIDTPLGTTVYTVISNNGGCAANATISILVVPLPNVSVVANPTSVCLGISTTLTASGANTYSWIPSLASGNTFIDTPSATTNYTVVGFNAAGCPNYTTITVSVVPAPAISIVASSPSVCAGSSGTLTGVGATNYTWMPGLQTGSLLVINPAGPTTYTLIADNGGCTATTTAFIGIYPLPNINASASSVSICPGDSIQLTAGGGISYTWQPVGLSGQTITGHPAATTTYTVYGSNANGCINFANVTVSVNPMANITVVASPTGICQGGTVTLTAGGGLSYTWNPGAQTNNPISVTPSITTIYTLMAFDASGCTGSFTVPVNVFQNPTITISPFNASVCAGSPITLTATGATNYTWSPSGTTSSVTVESPTVFTTYTVNGDNGGLCFASATVDVFVNPIPKNVIAASIGTVSCSSPTVQLVGNCATPNVSYAWVGPQGYTASVQNPIASGIWGTFTLIVTDNVTGCTAMDTTNVPTDNSIPLVLPVTSGSITCAVSTVTLNAVNTTTNPAYSWTGPAAFTSTIQSPTVTVQGTYTITVTDLSSTCSSSAVVTVGTHTNVTITASITPATCDGNGASNNDASISVSGFTLTDVYDLVSGTSYTGTATYATAAPIPTNGIISSNLANPSTTVAYTIRLFDGEGCRKDTTLFLVPVDCALRTLGIAKAVSNPSVNADGTYNVTYTVVIKNYDESKVKGTLKGIQLTENLATTFPAPLSFTIVDAPTVVSLGNNITINPAFDGSSQTGLVLPSGSVLDPQESDTITFTLKVKTNLFFISFKNSVAGLAVNSDNLTIIDSSNVGMDPDPDNDKNPYNNNVPTLISFAPNLFFGITKEGEIHKSDDESYDVTYTLTIHNLGNDTIRNVTLKDSLFEKTIKNPATYSMRSAPVVSGIGLTALASYDGKTNINLIDPVTSKMPPKTVTSVYFTINVIPGTETIISNSAYGNAVCAISPTQNTTVSDTSNAGNNPDVNGNGIWNEASDNVPTILLVPNTHSLFIPQGFSPDGDNINQYWVIQGLPTDATNQVTIFNRWGNKVYQHANYDNTWDGTPNVSGTLGKNKLPPGTYYYILDMKGSGIKPITGFVVIQY